MAIKNQTFTQHLHLIGACSISREWAGDKTAKQAWDECPYANWLLWWSAKDGADKWAIVLVACEIARTAVHLAKSQVALRAIEAAEKLANDPTDDNLEACRAACIVARHTAADDDNNATYAAYAAAYAATYVADYDDDDDATYVAYATYAAYYAAAARSSSHADSCAIIRRMLKQPWQESES